MPPLPRRQREPGQGSPALTDTLRVGDSLIISDMPYKILGVNRYHDYTELTCVDDDDKLHTITHRPPQAEKDETE